MIHACLHSMSSSSHRLSLVAMAFVTFNQYSSFFFVIAILAALTTVNSLSPNKNECAGPSAQTLGKVNGAPTHPRAKNVIHNMEDADDESGPSPGEGHGVPNLIRTSNGIHKGDTVAESGPSPGEGHGVPSLFKSSRTIHKEESGPSPGEGHGVRNLIRTSNAIQEEDTVAESGPSPGEGHGVPSLFRGSRAIQREESGPSPGEGHGVRSSMETKEWNL